MQISIKKTALKTQRADCVIVPIHTNSEFDASAALLDKWSTWAISAVIKSGDISGKTGETLMLHRPAGLNFARLLLVGYGDRKTSNRASFTKATEAAMGQVATCGARSALCCLPEVEVRDGDLEWKVHVCITAAGNALYRFTQLKTDADKPPPLARLNFIAAHATEKKIIGSGAAIGHALTAGQTLARDLANLPGNICTPTYLADQARSLAQQYPGIKTTVLDEKAMEKLGMGALLSVTRGSRQPARLITIEYAGITAPRDRKKRVQPIALVGKGITFDAGGISLKPAAAMDEMKYDMCGGASVLGTIKALAELALPLNVVGIIPSSENLPDGNASKPGDIVTSMSGQTIEILNTDAEGRLVLCDALTYVQRFNPVEVVDIATLTGACVIALGKHAAGLLGNEQPLIDELLAAGQESGDRAWQLPLWDEYDEQLKSNFADMANIGGREAGTITAACFLSRYTRKLRWAHLDIAGIAWNSGNSKGATGRPVPLLFHYLLNKTKRDSR